jgi:hypothetical protein
MAEIADLIIYGFKSAFLPYRVKARMLREVVEELVQKGVVPKSQIAVSATDSEAI